MNILPAKQQVAVLLRETSDLLSPRQYDLLKGVADAVDRATRVYADLVYADGLLGTHQLSDDQSSHRKQTIDSARWMFATDKVAPEQAVVDDIVPYVPLADRVQSDVAESLMLCRGFFGLIDRLVEAQFLFNHDTTKGLLSVNPEHVNVLLAELKEAPVDVHVLQSHLGNLRYPKFLGTKRLDSPIWSGRSVQVWQFQLNQSVVVDTPVVKDAIHAVTADVTADDAELCMDQVLASIRIWRQSLESNRDNPMLEYQANDVLYALLDMESKLERVQQYVQSDGFPGMN